MEKLKTKIRQRIYAGLLLLGAAILFFRTIRLSFFEDGLQRLVVFCVVLLFLEMIIDLCCAVFCVRWFAAGESAKSSLPLRFGAAATVLHLIRVIIFALGWTKTFYNFDVKPEYRQINTIDPFWVYFALILSVLGIIGLCIISIAIRYYKKNRQTNSRIFV